MPISLPINGTTYQYPVSGDIPDTNWGANATGWAAEVSLLMGGGGLIHPSCRVATTANITLSGLQTIDGVAVLSGNRVLVKNQTTASQNGIYIALTGAWSLGADANTTARVTSGMLVAIEEGTVSAGKLYALTTPNPITLASTSLTFTAVGGAGGSSAVDASGNITAGVSLTAASANSFIAKGQVVDGASAIACKLGSINALSTAGAKLLSIYSDNLTTERLFVAADGSLSLANNATINASGSNSTITLAANTNAGGVQLKITNTVANSAGKLIQAFRDNGTTEMFYVNGSGQLGIGGNSFLGLFANQFFYNPNQSNTASAIAHSFINQTTLNAAGTCIAAFYPDNNLTQKLAITSSGKLKFPTGAADAVVGQATLVGGTVTVSSTSVTASSLVSLTRSTVGGTVGDLRVGTLTAGTSFVINSASGTDTSVINWMIIN